MSQSSKAQRVHAGPAVLGYLAALPQPRDGISQPTAALRMGTVSESLVVQPWREIMCASYPLVQGKSQARLATHNSDETLTLGHCDSMVPPSLRELDEDK